MRARCAARVAAPQPNGSSNSAWPTTTDYARLRRGNRTQRVRSTHDSWQSADNARHVIRDLGSGLRETLLLIEGVRCTACVWLIERALGAMPGVVSVQVNAIARRARVIWRDSINTLPQLLQTLSRTGYEALPLDARGLDDLRRRESRDALKRLLVAGFGAMQAMMYATAIYLGAAESLDASTRELMRWLGLLVATPVVLYSARPFFAGALRSLEARRVGMDVPVALAIAAVYAASLIEALRGSGEVYFDSISMFVFFLLVGRYLEMRARHRARDLTDALARLTPPFADRQLADGTLQRVGIHELRVGDCVRVAEGGIVPADGVLLTERCHVDEALLSGESAAGGETPGRSAHRGQRARGWAGSRAHRAGWRRHRARGHRRARGASAGGASATAGRGRARRGALRRARAGIDGPDCRRVGNLRSGARVFRRGRSAGDFLPLRVCAGGSRGAHACVERSRTPRRAGREAGCVTGLDRMHSCHVRQDRHADRGHPVACRRADVRRHFAS